MLHRAEVLDLNADSAECCPVPSFRHLLAVGAYHLDEQAQERRGRVYLRALAGGRPIQLQALSSIDLPGVFDLKWQPPLAGASQPILGAALADGSLRLYRVCQNCLKEAVACL